MLRGISQNTSGRASCHRLNHPSRIAPRMRRRFPQDSNLGKSPTRLPGVHTKGGLPWSASPPRHMTCSQAHLSNGSSVVKGGQVERRRPSKSPRSGPRPVFRGEGPRKRRQPHAWFAAQSTCAPVGDAVPRHHRLFAGPGHVSAPAHETRLGSRDTRLWKRRVLPGTAAGHGWPSRWQLAVYA